ncbi:MAG: hypothetical protein JAZ19_20185 [Candidatus Thiodiazotropha taylori]|nr:hypothetical protein [Candidatus Thiodiazotropha taylori]MCG8039347.1 hypothetical protein [Candidatus Thiodiazotropha taylori]MCG8067802.1 hypothetical protein [Candidatus Thiodiazotropha taylori]
MNKIIITLLTFTFISISVSGCNKAKYSNAKILSQDESKIVLTVNKDLSSTVINANTGERVEPCIEDTSKTDMSKKEIFAKCYPKDFDPDSEVVSKSSVIIQKGSICGTITVGKRLYVVCQPPHNLGF